MNSTNTKLDVTRRSISPFFGELAGNADLAFEKTILDFLKKAAESGLDLESLTVTVFDEVFSSSAQDELFDGSLDSFLSMLMDEVGLRKRLGNAVLDIIMPATVLGYDLYELIDILEGQYAAKTPKRKVSSINHVLPVLKAKTRNAQGSIPGATGKKEQVALRKQR